MPRVLLSIGENTMAGRRMWRLFNKEAVTIMLWYATCIYLLIFLSFSQRQMTTQYLVTMLILVYGSIKLMFYIPFLDYLLIYSSEDID